jgi:hypothetical protein
MVCSLLIRGRGQLMGTTQSLTTSWPSLRESIALHLCIDTIEKSGDYLQLQVYAGLTQSPFLESPNERLEAFSAFRGTTFAKP